MEAAKGSLLKRWSAIGLFLLIAAGGAYGFHKFRGASPGETVTVTRADIVRAVYATGTVEPVRWTILSPEKTGRLMEIVRNEGEQVAKGDVVARMESRVVEERLQEEKTKLAFLKAEMERVRTLGRKDFVSRQEVENSELAWRESEKRVHILLREIEDLKLIATVDGIVLRRNVEAGETVQAGTPAFWVGSPKPLRITAEVDEEDIGQVELGQTALIKADAFPDRVFEGEVNEITPLGDPVNKVFRIRIALPDDTPLMINMTVEVNVISRHIPQALVIPAESESEGFVWQLVKGREQKTAVKTGMRSDGQVHVLEGLQEGDVILRVSPAKKQ